MKLVQRRSNKDDAARKLNLDVVFVFAERGIERRENDGEGVDRGLWGIRVTDLKEWNLLE